MPDGAYELLEAPLVVAGRELGELDVLRDLGRGRRLLVKRGSELADRLAFLEERTALRESALATSRGLVTVHLRSLPLAGSTCPGQRPSA